MFITTSGIKKIHTSQSPMSISSTNSGTDVIICSIPSLDENPLKIMYARSDKYNKLYRWIGKVEGKNYSKKCSVFKYIYSVMKEGHFLVSTRYRRKSGFVAPAGFSRNFVNLSDVIL